MRVLRYSKSVFFCTVMLASLCLISCSTVGPKIIQTDRNNYNLEIAKSEDSQLLLNIVRLRYLDSIDFLQITSITAQKTVEGSGTGSLSLFNPYRAQTGGSTLGSTVSYTDAPTVSFTPLQGATFTKNLLTPVSLKSVFYLTTTGWNIEKILLLSLEKMRSFYNQPGYVTLESAVQPRGYKTFLKIVRGLRILQIHNAIDVYFRVTNSGSQQIVVVFHGKKQTRAAIEAKRLLRVPVDAKYIIFTSDYYAHYPSHVVSVKTRSLVGILSYLANTVEIPMQDSAVVPYKQVNIPFMVIHSSRTPVKARIITHYRNHYFYIDECDEASKRSFILFYNLFQLTAGVTGGNSGIVLSLPVK